MTGGGVSKPVDPTIRCGLLLDLHNSIPTRAIRIRRFPVSRPDGSHSVVEIHLDRWRRVRQELHDSCGPCPSTVGSSWTISFAHPDLRGFTFEFHFSSTLDGIAVASRNSIGSPSGLVARHHITPNARLSRSSIFRQLRVRRCGIPDAMCDLSRHRMQERPVPRRCSALRPSDRDRRRLGALVDNPLQLNGRLSSQP